jgi:thiopeptide-type bacteriocin biosynthesis protein
VPTRARRLAPGSDWLYVKLYTGVATADRVLREAIAPLIDELERTGAVRQWFFIRYIDPDHHLRLRFHGDPERLHGEVLPGLYRAIAPLIDDGRIWRVQLDTYEREIERYGGLDATALCEDVFCADSRACLGIVGMLEDDAGLTERWQLTAWGMDRLLDDLGFDLAAKRALLERKRKMFGMEFDVDVGFAKLLGTRFRHERRSLDELFDAAGRDHPLAPGIAMLRERSQRAAPAIAELRRRAADGRLATPLPDIADSLLHMHANRLLRSNARAHELVIYDFLNRLYESIAARRKEPRATAGAA